MGEELLEAVGRPDESLPRGLRPVRIAAFRILPETRRELGQLVHFGGVVERRPLHGSRVVGVQDEVGLRVVVGANVVELGVVDDRPVATLAGRLDEGVNGLRLARSGRPGGEDMLAFGAVRKRDPYDLGRDMLGVLPLDPHLVVELIDLAHQVADRDDLLAADLAGLELLLAGVDEPRRGDREDREDAKPPHEERFAELSVVGLGVGLKPLQLRHLGVLVGALDPVETLDRELVGKRVTELFEQGRLGALEAVFLLQVGRRVVAQPEAHHAPHQGQDHQAPEHLHDHVDIVGEGLAAAKPSLALAAMDSSHDRTSLSERSSRGVRAQSQVCSTRPRRPRKEPSDGGRDRQGPRRSLGGVLAADQTVWRRPDRRTSEPPRARPWTSPCGKDGSPGRR